MPKKIGLWEHFRMLAQFKGREDRASFWPYAALIFGLNAVGTWAVMIPVMMVSFSKVQQFAADHPNQVNVVSGPGEYSVSLEASAQQFMPDFSAIIGGMTIIALITILLYAAAVVRRLHDRGMSGWWGLMPVPFLLYSLIQMPRAFSSARIGQQADLGIFFSVFFSNMLYLIALVVLIVFLAGASSPSPTRYDTDG